MKLYCTDRKQSGGHSSCNSGGDQGAAQGATQERAIRAGSQTNNSCLGSALSFNRPECIYIQFCQVAYKLEQEIALWDPNAVLEATSDPFKTLFVARVNFYTRYLF